MTATRRLSARRWRATPTAFCAASRPASAPARVMASASRALMIRSGAFASTPSKLLADPYAWRFDRPFQPPSLDVQVRRGHRPATRRKRSPARRPPASRDTSASRRRRWSSTSSTCAASRGSIRRSPKLRAAPSRASRIRRRSSILAKLGVTAVEIMPADPFIDDRHMPPLGLSNAWGYNSVVFGSPDPRLAPGGWAEVRAATDALHAAGMEAILDVVFNHNGESDQLGPTLSFRGLDNHGLVPARPKQSGALHQRHRHRQLPRARPAAGR